MGCACASACDTTDNWVRSATFPTDWLTDSKTGGVDYSHSFYLSSRRTGAVRLAVPYPQHAASRMPHVAAACRSAQLLFNYSPQCTGQKLATTVFGETGRNRSSTLALDESMEWQTTERISERSVLLEDGLTEICTRHSGSCMSRTTQGAPMGTVTAPVAAAENRSDSDILCPLRRTVPKREKPPFSETINVTAHGSP